MAAIKGNIFNKNKYGKGHNARFDRLSPSEEQGRDRGGEELCKIYDILARMGRQSGQTNDEVSKNQIEKIIETVKEFDFINFVQNVQEVVHLKRQGSEGITIGIRENDEKKVLKLVDWKTWQPRRINKTPLEFLLNKVVLQNTIFPETPYKLLGVQKIEERTLHFAMVQPYIELQTGATLKEIDIDMRNRGFKRNVDGNYYSEDYFISDLNHENVLIIENGNLYYVAPIIQRNKHK